MDISIGCENEALGMKFDIIFYEKTSGFGCGIAYQHQGGFLNIENL